MTTVLDDIATVPRQRHESPPAASRVFRPDIEGLRAVAVLLVVLYHAGIPRLTGGYVGVDVFFVISGFLITGLLLREFEANGRISIGDFYARRARRILPIASLVLLATLAGCALVLGASRLDSVAQDGLWTSIFAANFHFAASGADYLNATAPPSPLQHFWSLAVEEQFYVLWPALLWLALAIGKRFGGRPKSVAALTAIVAIMSSFAWSVTQTAQDANQAYFSPWTRGWELGAGAVAAICAVRLARLPGLAAALCGWVGLGLIAYSALTFDTNTAFPGSAAAVPVVGSVLVIVGGLVARRGGPEVLLASGAARRIGGWSYSLYLIHWPILVIVTSKFPGVGLWVKVGLVAVSTAVSALTYRFIENPARRSPRLRKSVRNSLILGLVAVMATACYSGMFIVGGKAEDQQVTARFEVQQQLTQTRTGGGVDSSTEVRAAVLESLGATALPATLQPPVELAAKDMSPAYQNGCLVDTTPLVSPPCIFGDPSGTRTVVLFGDSHAAQWLPALSAVGVRNQFKIVVLTKHSCPVADVSTYDGILKRAYTECGKWRTWALAEIKATKPAVVIGSETAEALVDASGKQIPENDRVWQRGLATTLKELESSAGAVYMLSDTPVHHTNVPACLQQNTSNIQLCSDPAEVAVGRNDHPEEKAVVEAAGAGFVDVTSWLCARGECPAVINNIVTDFDDNHLTATYSRYLAHSLGVAVGLEPEFAAAQEPLGAQVEKAVAAAANLTKAPANVSPPVRLAGKDISPAYTDGCLVEAELVKSPDCVFGDVESGKKVVLFGDSHAAQWMSGLVDSATRSGFSLTVLTKGNCPAVALSVYSTELQRTFNECDRWRESAIARIAALKPALVVVSSTFHGVRVSEGGRAAAVTEAAWDRGLTTTLAAIKASGADVTVVGDVANHDGPVPDCLELHSSDLRQCATPVLQGNLTDHEIKQSAVARAAGGKYVSVQPWFCTATICPAVINGIVTEFDDSHLTATYSKYLGHALGVALGLES